MNEDLFPDDVRPARELCSPRFEAEDYDWCASGGSDILGEQRPSHHRVHAQHAEVVSGHQFTEHGVTFDAREAQVIESQDFGESRILFLEILKFMPRKPVVLSVPVHPRESIKAIRIAHGEGPQHIGVEYGEERGVQAQAQGDGGHHGEGEQRRAAEAPHGVADILQQRFDPSGAARIAAGFLGLVDAAKPDTSRARGVIRGHPGGEVPAGLGGDVEPQLLVEFALHPAPHHERAQAQENVAPVHIRPPPGCGRWRPPAGTNVRFRAPAACGRKPSGGRSARGGLRPRHPIPL